MLYTLWDIFDKMEINVWYSMTELSKLIYGCEVNYPQPEYQNLSNKVSKLRQHKAIERKSEGRGTYKVRFRRIKD